MLESLDRAARAVAESVFLKEIIAVGEPVFDEQPGKANREKIPELRPAVKADATITAASSATISLRDKP